MDSHFELSDELFEAQFQNCTLNPALFNHEAHLRLAWIHVTKCGVEGAIENITSQLFSFVVSQGEINKYNKTLTVAAVRAVNHFVDKSGTDNFYDFIQQFPKLKSNFKELMRTHYKVDIFNAEIAKQNYLEPDLLPFS